ncbi:MAG: RNA methyltransferase substrate-binding domain-containing protein, partial [Gammaproteobacteria bacterium]
MRRGSKRGDDPSLVFGLHAVTHLLRTAPERVLELKLARERHDQRLQDIVDLALVAGIKPQTVERRVLDQASEGAAHQGTMARIRP